MSSFSQWFVSFQKSNTLKQVTWVCGSEVVLVDDVVETLRGVPDLREWNIHSFVVGEDRERDIFASLDQHPIDGRSPRLVIVRNADKIKKTQRIIDWVATKNKNPLTSVIFVSNSEALERLPQTLEQRSSRAKGDLLPHIAAISARGAVIECRPFTQATAKHAVSWVESKVAIRRGVAGYLLDRANGDLRLVSDAVRKLQVFPEEISESTINLLLSEQPRSTFVDALLALDKKTALLALESIPFEDYSKIVGQLDQRLEVLGTVHEMMISHNSLPQISARLGTMGFLAKDLMPISKSYDNKRRLALRHILAVVDEAIRGGVRSGPLELLTHYW